MITPGTEWQARALADAAADEARDYRDMGGNGTRRAAYCQGVADILRAIEGSGDPERTAELSAIFARYNRNL